MAEETIANHILMTTQSHKSALRKQFLKLRGAYSAQERAKFSRAIYDHLLTVDQFKNAESVMVYLTIGSEVETLFIVDELIREQKKVVIPYCDKNTLGIAQITNLQTQITDGLYGVMEPVLTIRDNFNKHDLECVLCPGVAFDMRGYRLGRGKAFYDSFLCDIKSNAFVAGLAFNCQISKEPLPVDCHDIAMDEVVTECGPVIKKRGSSENSVESTTLIR
ncbi:5-formyltetrahydrofolate cyclo-ligase [Chitinispirillales bacterium ANBcel5]|uniref:5-formyltetrahydrofolate cyclo-ligase n=1 Tax=Cellulosispirillum alkaliphilum TaxID=3039283 RepID=UPI002A564DBF|nr:5-formyltetrahydrofolate cyclo-ligase [Chitinispirillales bacterium ANBcel5]